jgi:hypothetical protein
LTTSPTPANIKHTIQIFPVSVDLVSEHAEKFVDTGRGDEKHINHHKNRLYGDIGREKPARYLIRAPSRWKWMSMGVEKRGNTY